jgi:tripartite ATP-independent transporter DctM subunit
MSPADVALILLGGFFLLLALRVPVAFALGIASLPPFFVDPRVSLGVLFDTMYASFNSFLLLAVPFFLLAANLMNAGGITDRMLRLSRALVGHLPGALGQINVVLSVLFAGVSGSSTADAASQSKIFIPAMTKEGYDLSFAVANTAVSSVLAVVIPPSILMIIWGGTMSTSIGALFVGGLLPGLGLTVAMMITVHVYAKVRHYPTYERASWRELGNSLVVAGPALMTPLIIIGGKIFGWFTATEAAVVAVLYSMALALLVYREIGPRALFGTLVDTGRFSAVSLFALGTASVFGWLLAYYKVPNALLASASSWGMGLAETGFFVAAVFLVVGCFLDAIPAIIIVGTMLQPITVQAGMDPIHFALIGIVSLAFGLVTPPYGLCLLIAAAIGGIPLREVMRDVMIMLGPLLFVLGTLVLFPEVYLFLPRMLGPEAAP